MASPCRSIRSDDIEPRLSPRGVGEGSDMKFVVTMSVAALAALGSTAARRPAIRCVGQQLVGAGISFNPTARCLALSVRPLQKPFACRDQFTAIHQFDDGIYPWRD